MSYATYKRLSDLRYLIADLGKHGGAISPSIYDTAYVFRTAPNTVDQSLVLNWLFSQQQPDGGWGNTASPRARDLPTLATILALHPYTGQIHIRDSVEAGLAFLGTHAPEH